MEIQFSEVFFFVQVAKKLLMKLNWLTVVFFQANETSKTEEFT